MSIERLTAANEHIQALFDAVPPSTATAAELMGALRQYGDHRREVDAALENLIAQCIAEGKPRAAEMARELLASSPFADHSGEPRWSGYTANPTRRSARTRGVGRAS